MGVSHGHGHSHANPLSSSSGTSAGVRALKFGVAGLGITTVIQVVLLLFSGSVALLGDTLHNGVDVAGTAIVWVAFVLSRKVPSAGFKYGYHRFEDLAGLVVGMLIAASAGLVLFESVRAFGGSPNLSRPGLVLAAGIAGFVGNELVAQYKLRTGRRIGSAALVADGQHSRADGLTSLGVVAAAVAIMLNAAWLDAVIGLGIGLLIAWTAVQSGREVLLRLLDHGDPEIHHQLEHAAEDVTGFDHINDLRVRHLGRTVHVVAHVCMPAGYSLARAHDVAEDLRHAWLHVVPAESVIDIHADPFEPGIPTSHLPVPTHAH